MGGLSCAFSSRHPPPSDRWLRLLPFLLILPPQRPQLLRQLPQPGHRRPLRQLLPPRDAGSNRMSSRFPSNGIAILVAVFLFRGSHTSVL